MEHYFSPTFTNLKAKTVVIASVWTGMYKTRESFLIGCWLSGSLAEPSLSRHVANQKTFPRFIRSDPDWSYDMTAALALSQSSDHW
jgi:hypothetical protein